MMLLQRFVNYIQEQHLVPSGEKVLLAVSGGRDSVTMAYLFFQARIPFVVAHCNFHLRPGDCDRDELFVRRLAKTFHAPYVSVDFETIAYAKSNGLSIEEAARELRYRWFASLCQGQDYACLAVAHHRDDSIETFFLNLFRGTGIAGLHGIRPQTTLYGMRVIRPMLCFSRSDIDRYVEEQGIAYVEDVTNKSSVPRRNRIRNELLPRLRKYYPSIDKTMDANIRHLAEAEQIYDNYIALMREQLIKIMPRRVPTIPVPVQGIKLDDIPHPRTTILFELLRPYGVNEKTVQCILSGNVGTGASFSTPSHHIFSDRGWLVIGKRVAPVEPIVCMEESHLSNGKPGIFVDADLVTPPFTLRLWQPGDKIAPLGFPHSRKVSDQLKDMKLSMLDKEHVWVLADASGSIVWIVGLVLSHRFRVTSRTTRTLHIFLDTM